jgi:hypothetical protein
MCNQNNLKTTGKSKNSDFIMEQKMHLRNFSPKTIEACLYYSKKNLKIRKLKT